jgi:hypothetical protein
MHEMPKTYYGASLLVVTAVHPPELIETLNTLKLKGRRITLYSLAEEPPPFLSGILSVHRPFVEVSSEMK